MLSFEANKLKMPLMYKDGIERGGNQTFAIYQRATGEREEYSYNYINEQCDKLIEKLKAAGLKKGDRIGVIASLRPWWYSLSYACLQSGYIMVCIDPGVPALQVQNLLLQTEVRAVFTTLNKVHLPEELNEFIPVYAIDEDFPLLSKCDKVNDLLDDAKTLPEDTFYILFSSGTTSENRKAVLLKHSTVTMGIEYGMCTDGGVYKNTSAYTPRECDLMLFPPYHIAGLLCATYDIYCNTKIIMLERITPKGLVKALNDLKPDNICTVPSMLTSFYKKIVAGYSNNVITKKLINSLLAISGFLRKHFGLKVGLVLLKSLNEKAFGGNMKGFMIGASPFDETAHKFYLNMGIDVSSAYGLTELGAPLAVTGQGYYPGSTGRVIRHTSMMDIRIAKPDENGKGEVEILSPYRMISYMDPKDNEGCFTEDGYFKTGDLGYFNKQNCLVICGRIKESIVLRNGEKLLPEEIENKYQDVDCVKELVAFKIPGEGGCDDFAIAIIKDHEKGIPDEAMITRIYERADNLPPIYHPKEVYVLKELPLSSSHKVQRFRLTEMVVSGKDTPVTDASLIKVDEDEVTAELRKMLIEVGGASWKQQELTQGLLLNLDSLSVVNLYVLIEEKWHIDLFQSSVQPETFGDLLDIVKNYEVVDKNNKQAIDLSQYPLPISKFGRFTNKALLKAIKINWHLHAYGTEKLSSSQNYLICSNHRTVLDPAFILSCLDPKIAEKTCVVGKAELINDKHLSKIVATQNFIPVDRTGNSIKTLERCKELLLEGYNVLIFPEGTNVQNNTKMYSLRNGAAKLAISTGKPIIPVHITGIAHFEGETSNFALPGNKAKVSIKFGEAFNYQGNDINELNEIIRTTIEELD